MINTTSVTVMEVARLGAFTLHATADPRAWDLEYPHHPTGEIRLTDQETLKLVPFYFALVCDDHADAVGRYDWRSVREFLCAHLLMYISGQPSRHSLMLSSQATDEPEPSKYLQANTPYLKLLHPFFLMTQPSVLFLDSSTLWVGVRPGIGIKVRPIIQDDAPSLEFSWIKTPSQDNRSFRVEHGNTAYKCRVIDMSVGDSVWVYDNDELEVFRRRVLDVLAP